MRVRAFQHLHETLRRQILAGELRDGARLPAEEQLASRFGVSRVTVREALSVLADEGLILRHHGVGSFVSPHATKISAGIEKLGSFTEALRYRAKAADVVVGIQEIALGADLATALDVAAGRRAFEIRSVRSVDGTPGIYCVDVLSPDVVSDRQVLERRYECESLLDFLQQAAGIDIRALPMSIEAASAAGEIAERLEIAPGTPLVHLHGAGFSGSSRPVYYSSNFFRTDIVRLTLVRRK
jgi:GntR family transcriptional regulator